MTVELSKASFGAIISENSVNWTEIGDWYN